MTQIWTPNLRDPMAENFDYFATEFPYIFTTSPGFFQSCVHILHEYAPSWQKQYCISS
jgi:hypothetical protein